MSSSTSTVTMRDIADLCGVARPVVSMWRKRTTVEGRVVPFPEPIPTRAGGEQFDVDEICEYLRRTGRGNNAEAALDAGAFTVPADADLTELTVLLCLRTLHCDDLTGANVVAVADTVDPGDRLLLREVRGMSHSAINAATEYVDQLFAASFGPPDALNRLLRSRVGRIAREPQLSEPAANFVGTIAAALLAHLGEESDLVDGSAGRSTAGLQVAGAIERPVLIAGSGVEARVLRREATLRQIALDVTEGARALRVDSVLGLDTDQALNRLDDLALELSPGDLAVGLGPAEVLCGQLRDQQCELLRDRMLRNHVVRLAVRLPRGLWTGGRRQALGLWILGSTRDDVRRIAVADLSDLSLADIDGTALATDAVAAADHDARHHFTYALRRETATIVATDHVVTRGVRARTPGTRPDPFQRLSDLVAQLAVEPERVQVRISRSGGAWAATATVAELRGQRKLKLVSGARLDLAWASSKGTVEVVTPEAEWQRVAFDPLDLEARASHAARTEPGDVVFTTSPPRALVEERGGRLIPTPARVLRLADDAPVGPHSLACQINRMPGSARDALAWVIRLTGTGELEDRLAGLADARRDLTARLDALDELGDLLIDAIATGELTIDPHDEQET